MAPSAATGRGEAPRLVLVSWDGAGDVLVDRLLAEGHLPHLAALAARGTQAAQVIGTVPSKTAPSHASIYTGCWPSSHGVSANSVPLDASAPLPEALRRGFDAGALHADPFFATATRAGWRVAVAGATQYAPHDQLAHRLRTGDTTRDADIDERFVSFSGFDDFLARPLVLDAAALQPASGWRRTPPHHGPALELLAAGGDAPVHALLYDSPDDPTDGFDRVLLRQGKKSGRGHPVDQVLVPVDAARPEGSVVPRPEASTWSRPFVLRDGEFHGATFFRLFELAPDGQSLVLYRRLAVHNRGSAPAGLATAYRDAGGVLDKPFESYGRGTLGLPLMVGGDGRAEARLLEIVAFQTDRQIAASRVLWETAQPDALFHYSSLLDHLGHGWLGALDPESSRYEPAVAERLWTVFAAAARETDRWLGSLVELAGDDAVIALVSDHGMTWSDRLFWPDRILERAGLLVRSDSTGTAVDWDATQIGTLEGSFLLRVNPRLNLAPDERSRVVARAAEALLGARDAAGHPLVHRVFEAGTFASRGLTPTVGDLFLDPAPGAYPLRGLGRGEGSPEDPIAIASPVLWGQGVHGHWPERREMHSIFYLAGPGVAAGVTTPTVDQIDIVPTLARLLGLPTPTDACGRVVAEALDR